MVSGMHSVNRRLCQNKRFPTVQGFTMNELLLAPSILEIVFEKKSYHCSLRPIHAKRQQLYTFLFQNHIDTLNGCRQNHSVLMTVSTANGGSKGGQNSFIFIQFSAKKRYSRSTRRTVRKRLAPKHM